MHGNDDSGAYGVLGSKPDEDLTPVNVAIIGLAGQCLKTQRLERELQSLRSSVWWMQLWFVVLSMAVLIGAIGRAIG